jgi:transposase InsO family protein
MKMKSKNESWGQFRLQVLGQLLASPPVDRGGLSLEIERLSSLTWTHPIEKEPVRFAFSTIERWYYQALKSGTDTAMALARKRRCDANGSKLDIVLCRQLRGQHKQHPGWSAKLHFDNLQAFARSDKISDSFSYQTVRRHMRSNGMIKTKRQRGLLREGQKIARQALDAHEVRSYEASHVGGLWHLDFHHAKRPILTPNGEWITPELFAVIDDRSRLICHLQWYLTETTQDLVHGFSQALMRRGLPRTLMTDNGSAMTSAEFTQGLSRLGIIHETTLAYSPYQNGKIECFWGQIEGRLMAMLEGKKEISLTELNRMTHAWVEMDYHHQTHSETMQTPIDRFSGGPSVLRPSLTSIDLRLAFRMELTRTQRRSDGTATIEGVRFEIPGRFRHMHKISVRFARWDLSDVSLVSQETNQILCALYPIDKEKNSNGRRRQITEHSIEEPLENRDAEALPPYLLELMKRFDESGFLPPFITQD